MSRESTISPWVWVAIMLFAGATAAYLATPKVKRVVFTKPPEVKVIAYAV